MRKKERKSSSAILQLLAFAEKEDGCLGTNILEKTRHERASPGASIPNLEHGSSWTRRVEP
jgi:hypothetical protein